MQPIHIAGLVVLAIVYRWLLPVRWRQWFLLVTSIIGIYWFQFLWAGSASPRVIVYPTMTLGLTLGVWWLIRPDEPTSQQENRATFLVTLLAALGIVLLLEWRRTGLHELNIFGLKRGATLLLTAAAIFIGSRRWQWPKQTHLWLTAIGILTIVGLFVLFKQPTLNTLLFELLARSIGLSYLPEAQWIGFSYVAFRLIHVLRDTQTGKIPHLTLRQYLTYVIFPPAYLSGPIDRVERFNQDYEELNANRALPASQVIDGGSRVMIGMFKKFVIADTLAFFALSPYSVLGEGQALWTWITLYTYAFQLYFDFSGYTDIAIGLGMLIGIKLPENFNQPYLKQNLTSFWQSWHITLSNWVRFYVFNPLARGMLKNKQIKRSPRLVLFISHITTMLVIGLWHGISWNFAIWGVWHGIGLFIHKVWSDRTAKWYRSLEEKPRLKRAWSVAGVLLTFHYVLFGWVWFALPDPARSIQTFRNLLGV